MHNEYFLGRFHVYSRYHLCSKMTVAR